MKNERRVIDLSHKVDVEEQKPDQTKSLKQRSVSVFDSEEYRDAKISIKMHIGTHMDGPCHMLREAKTLDQYPPCRFIGDTVVLDAVGRETIDVDLLQNPLVRESDFIIIKTGFHKKYFNEEYFSSYPKVTISFAERIAALGITLLAMDTPSPDYYPHNIHRLLFENDVLLVENLANLDALPLDRIVRLYCFPVKIAGDCAPVRVIAKYMK